MSSAAAPLVPHDVADAGAAEEGGTPPCPACGGGDFAPLERVTDRCHGIPGEFLLLRCRGCGVVTYAPRLDGATLARYYPPDYYAYRLDPEPDPATLRGRLRALLDDLHLGLRRDPAARLLWRPLLAPLLWWKHVHGYARHLRVLAPAPADRSTARARRLLDIGCGGGGFLLKARRMGFRCEGIEPGLRADPGLAAAMATAGVDLTEPGAEVAGAPTEGPRARILVHACRLEEFDPGARRFDVITLNHVFEHFEDPGAAWRRLDGWLAPGGKVLVRMPDTASLGFRRHRGCWFGLEVPRHTYLFDGGNFELFAARHGYRVIAREGECVPIHWQWALKRRLTGRLYAAPSWLDHPLLSAALLPLVPLFVALGWADMQAIWLERATDAPPPTPAG